jgi:hypothetical protein
VDVHAPFDKGKLVVQRHVHKSAHRGLLDRARSHSMGTEGADALPRWDPSTSFLCLALNTNSSRSGIDSIAHTLVVPDSIDLKHLFESFARQGSNL